MKCEREKAVDWILELWSNPLGVSKLPGTLDAIIREQQLAAMERLADALFDWLPPGSDPMVSQKIAALLDEEKPE